MERLWLKIGDSRCCVTFDKSRCQTSRNFQGLWNTDINIKSESNKYGLLYKDLPEVEKAWAILRRFRKSVGFLINGSLQWV